MANVRPWNTHVHEAHMRETNRCGNRWSIHISVYVPYCTLRMVVKESHETKIPVSGLCTSDDVKNRERNGHDRQQTSTSCGEMTQRLHIR